MNWKEFLMTKVGEIYNRLLKFSENNSFEILPVDENDVEELININKKQFSNVMPLEYIEEYLHSTVDWSISKKGVLNGKIIGCYLFNNNQIIDLQDIEWKEDINKYKGKHGIEGVSLLVLPQYRNLGYGKELRNIPFSTGADYIWGQHLKGLNNIDNWINFGRRVIGEDEGIYITIMDLK